MECHRRNEYGRDHQDARRIAQAILAAIDVPYLPITTRAYLYLSGTPFRALATGEFIEEQIFNWTYTDEQRAKEEFAQKNPGKWNPYGALPQMRLLTYKMPEEILAIAHDGEFEEFDLNAFFEASGTGKDAKFKHDHHVQKWLDIIRGQYAPRTVESLKTGTPPPFPYSDVRLLPYLQHSFWFGEAIKAWSKPVGQLERLHERYGKKVLLTEIGYPTPGSMGTWAGEQGLNLVTLELEDASLYTLKDRHVPILLDLMTDKFEL